MWEFYNLTKKDNIQSQPILGLAIGVFLFVANFLIATNRVSSKLMIVIIPLIALLPVAELYRKKERPFANIAYTVLGVLYVAMPFSLLNYVVHPPMATGEFRPEILLGFIFMIWASDTGAYFSGSMLGKRKLFKRISPKKSWEGSIGGALFAMAVAFGISQYYDIIDIVQWLTISIIAVVMGTYGDLTESLFKRSINIKDSGNILPGHGGMLDRFDSLLLSAPIVYAYIELWNEFVVN